ncbi:hypothetical protein V5799_034395 [Amblyomma americanum]|uniref:Uncharacterized protein n=1 Tax=Amblyomma americanum TaxID=6943 RepID=A0AAQ4DKK7_AMBAM
MDEKAHSIHRVDTVNILVYTFLLILTVCIIWLFKRRRARFLHETGLAIIFGLIVGAIVRYASEETELSHVRVLPMQGSNYSDAVPPDNVFVLLEIAKTDLGRKENKTYAYTFQGEVTDVESKKLNQKRHLMLTATSLIAIVTVIVCGGFTTQLLAWLSIPFVLMSTCYLISWIWQTSAWPFNMKGWTRGYILPCKIRPCGSVHRLSLSVLSVAFSLSPNPY